MLFITSVSSYKREEGRGNAEFLWFFSSCFLNKELGFGNTTQWEKIVSIKGKIFDLHTCPSKYSTQQDSQ